MMYGPVPFTNDLNQNAAALVEYFRLAGEEKVPVRTFVVRVGNEVRTTAVGPGKYKSALFMLYLFMRYGEGQVSFHVTNETIAEAVRYFGPEIVTDAARPDTKHTTARFLLYYPGTEIMLERA